MTALERFEAKYTPGRVSGCWPWEAATIPAGYGSFWFDSRVQLAHRVSWHLYRGAVPRGLLVLHRCNVKNCVNPDHLYLGTYSDNTLHAYRDGLMHNANGVKTHCKHGHEFTHENTYKGTQGARNPDHIMRVCKTCRRQRMRRYKAA